MLGQRARDFGRLRREEYDVLVVGGGATGAGTALEAASRGLRTALVERHDFASGTSSRSTKLVHGGVRYLEQAVRHADRSQFHLVREALRERALLLANAPHLARALALLTPIYGALELPYYFTGLKLYDILAGRANLKPSRLIGRDQAVERFPMLRHEGLRGAVEYHDGQFDDARMNVALALTAAREGAVVLNYAEVTELTKRAGRVIGAVVRGSLPGDPGPVEVAARVVVNATGPFADGLRRIDDPSTPEILETSSGVHIVLPARFSPPDTGLLIPKTEDGRVLFLLPWLGHTLVGTTDNPAPVQEDPRASEEDVAYILRHVREYFDLPVERSDVLSTWSGLRPLVRPDAIASLEGEVATHPSARPAAEGGPKATARLSRDHTILVSPTGLVTITGGKWTTYRRMAEDTIDMAIHHAALAPTKESVTSHLKLVGAEEFQDDGGVRLTSTFGLPIDVAAHLSAAYGDRAEVVARLASAGLRERLAPGLPYLEAEVVYARDHEYAHSAADVLERRLRLGFLDTRAAAAAQERVQALLQTRAP
ncbi:MAG: FAD-dependent oxidoreductase [Trueperaceae bacterium]